GAVVTGRRVRSWRELPRARAYLFDTTPRALTEIWAEKMPPRAARMLRNFPYGPGAAEVDFVLSEAAPWTAARPHRAGTIHVGLCARARGVDPGRDGVCDPPDREVRARLPRRRRRVPCDPRREPGAP